MRKYAICSGMTKSYVKTLTVSDTEVLIDFTKDVKLAARLEERAKAESLLELVPKSKLVAVECDEVGRVKT